MGLIAIEVAITKASQSSEVSYAFSIWNARRTLHSRDRLLGVHR